MPSAPELGTSAIQRNTVSQSFAISAKLSTQWTMQTNFLKNGCQREWATVLWFQDFISNRKQLVHVNGANSFLRLLSIGVPQGSTWGPLLYLIYILMIYHSARNFLHSYSPMAMTLHPASLCHKLRELQKSSKNWKKCLIFSVPTNLHFTLPKQNLFYSPW